MQTISASYKCFILSLLNCLLQNRPLPADRLSEPPSIFVVGLSRNSPADQVTMLEMVRLEEKRLGSAS